MNKIRNTFLIRLEFLSTKDSDENFQTSQWKIINKVKAVGFT